MSGPDRLGKGLLGGEALGIGAGAGEGAARRLGALHLCEDALFKTLAETVEGRLDALDIAEVGTKAEAHDRSAEHTSELQSLMRISYAVFWLKKKINTNTQA